MDMRKTSIPTVAVIALAALAIATPSSAYTTICEKNPQACGSDVKLPPRPQPLPPPLPDPKPQPKPREASKSKPGLGTGVTRVERIR